MSKKTLNQANLETLGPARLAALLLEISDGSADIKRRLRLELSHNLGPDALAADVRKRLATLRKSKTYVGWRKRKALIKDLMTQRAMIVDKIAPDDPTTAFELLWDFVAMAPSIYARVDDSKGDVAKVFHTALIQFEQITATARLDPIVLADQVWDALCDNSCGEWTGLIPAMALALGTKGLTHLKSKVETYSQATAPAAQDTHDAIAFLRQLRDGDDYVAKRKARFIKDCLQQIATAQGDTDSYIAQFTDDDLARKDIAAQVAQMLLDTGQPDAALTALQGAQQDPTEHPAWHTQYVTSLEALGRTDTAQSHRWACFEATLNAGHLRDYLARLPDFDDVEAEDRAKAYVANFPNASAALAFCAAWPDGVTAAQIIERRTAEIEPTRYDLLGPLAEALRARQPKAAALLWRAMIDVTLGHGNTTRYGQAADYLADCEAVDGDISDYTPFPDHSSYLATLRDTFARKATFWAKVD